MSEDVIRTEDVLLCPVCGSEDCGVLYSSLRDRLFGTPGEWTLKRCSQCGLIFLGPRPTLDEVRKAYANYCTHFHAELSKENSLARRTYRSVKSGYLNKRWGYYSDLKPWQVFLAFLLYLHPRRRVDLDFSVMYLQATPGGRVIDVGCGNGELIQRLGGLGWESEGVDIDELAVRAARKRGLKAHVGTLESQNYASNSFDAVTMSHVIEHVHDPLKLLRESRRILKPGGRLIIATPNAESWGHKHYGIDWVGLDPPRHLHVFAASSLRRLLKQAEFQEVEVSTTMRLADTLFAASESIRRTGRHEMGSSQPLTVRIWARAMQLVEWIILNIKPFAGHEIIFVAKKQRDETA